MKKLIFSCMVAVAAVMMMLTSCLDSKGGSWKETAYGVVTLLNYTTPVVNVGSAYIYSEEIRKSYLMRELEEGDCIRFPFEVDTDSEANQNVSEKGYYTATVSYWEKYPRTNNIYNTIQDTTQIMNNEAALADIQLSSVFIEDMLFLQPIFEKYYQDQANTYNLSFNGSQQPATIEGKRVYEVYVRTITTDPGKTNTSSYSNTGMVNAFNMSDFLTVAYRTEKAEKQEYVYVRLKFVKEFDEDKTAIKTWGTTALMTFAVPTDK